MEIVVMSLETQDGAVCLGGVSFQELLIGE